MKLSKIEFAKWKTGSNIKNEEIYTNYWNNEIFAMILNIFFISNT